jgi:hypothetical protein
LKARTAKEYVVPLVSPVAVMVVVEVLVRRKSGGAVMTW